MQGRQLNLDILIQEYRRMCKMRSLGKETQSDMMKSSEVALVVNEEKKCFKCGKTGHVKKTVLRRIQMMI